MRTLARGLRTRVRALLPRTIRSHCLLPVKRSHGQVATQATAVHMDGGGLHSHSCRCFLSHELTRRLVASGHLALLPLVNPRPLDPGTLPPPSL